MRRAALRLCALSLLLALGCGDDALEQHAPDAQAPPPLEGVTCQDGVARLQACVAAHCEATPSAACDAFEATPNGSLRGASYDPCEGMGQAAVDRLLGASCAALLEEAGLVLDGKADGACPPYFPWCADLSMGETGFDVEVLDSAPGRITLQIEVEDLRYSSVALGGAAYHALSLAEAGPTLEIGAPAVPSVGALIGVPPGTDAAWVSAMTVEASTTLEGLHLAPKQPQTVEDEPPAEFTLDAARYATDADYPGIQHEVAPIATWRNFRVIPLQTFPIQYNPVSGRLTVATRYTVTVEYADVEDEALDTVDDGEGAQAPAYDDALVNYPEVSDAEGGGTDDPERVRYLMIVADELLEAIGPLVQLKESQGLKTVVLSVSELVGEAPLTERVKAAIRAQYEASSVEYVLLVGDVDLIPMYMWDRLPSDSWYGLLAGEDLLPEVLVGRIAGKTLEEAQIHIQKTIDHQLQGEEARAWRKHVLLTAHEERYPRKYTECVESIRNAEYASKEAVFHKLYGGERATNAEVTARINEGVGVVNYRGHGSDDAWIDWNGSDYIVSEAGLTNAGRTPVVFSIACNNMKMDAAAPSMAEEWVLHPEGGAVAVLGATRPSYTVVNHDFDRYLFEALLTEGIQEFGPVVARATAKLVTQYGDERMLRANARMYALLGDPSINIGAAFATPAPAPEPEAASILINEILADPPEDPFGDANGDGVRHFGDDEFIELINASAEAVDISGWTLADAQRERISFPEGTTVEPGGLVVIFGGGEPAVIPMGEAQIFVAERGLKLNNTGDTVTLSDAEGAPVDVVLYGEELAKGGSMVRAVEGDPEAAFEPHGGEPPYSPGHLRE